MANRTAQENNARKLTFKFGKSGKRQSRFIGIGRNAWRYLKILAVAGVVAGIGSGLLFLEKYAGKEVPLAEKLGRLELLNVPLWVNDRLKQTIAAIAAADGEDFKLDENGAKAIADRLKNFSWFDAVRVQTTNDAFRVEAEFRRPVALIKSGQKKFYVDKNLVVMDYIGGIHLPIVEVSGIMAKDVPLPGRSWPQEDLEAAVTVLELINKMDWLLRLNKPLLYEIAGIDVSNFQGRAALGRAHIILIAPDGTEVLWGAQVGASQKNLEAREDEKLAMLYTFYQENKTLQNRVKYIELRYPHKIIPEPIKSY